MRNALYSLVRIHGRLSIHRYSLGLEREERLRVIGRFAVIAFRRVLRSDPAAFFVTRLASNHPLPHVTQ